MPDAGLPFDDVRALIRILPDGAETCAVDARDRAGAMLARLGEAQALVEWLAAWQGRSIPSLDRTFVALFAGSHGGADGSREAARKNLDALAAGAAALNQLCAQSDIGLKAFELALEIPSGDIAREPALDEAACAATIAFGMEAIAGGADLLCLSDIGAPGVGASAAAVLCAVTGDAVADFSEGEDATRVARALSHHEGRVGEPLEALRRLGGREIAALVGAILAARMERAPVLLDGSAALAAASVVHALDAKALAHCRLGAAPVSAGERRVSAKIGLEPILHWAFAPEPGAGAALGAALLKATLAFWRGATDHGRR